MSRKTILEEELSSNDMRLENILNAFTDGVYDYNITKGLTFINDNFYKILGYEPGEFIVTNEQWDALIHPDDLEIEHKMFYNHLADKTPRYVAEFRMLRKNGHYQWMSCTGKVIEYDKEGNPARLIGAIRSIHSKKILEQGMKVIIAGTNQYRGLEFFKYLTSHLAELLPSNYVTIATPSDSHSNQLNAIVSYQNGTFQEPFSYKQKHTPCDRIYQTKGVCCIESGIKEDYSMHELYHDDTIEGYYGLPFYDQKGRITGHLYALSQQKHNLVRWLESIMELFAQSIGSEIARMRNEEELSKLNRELDEQVRQRTEQLEKAVKDLDSFFYKASHDLRAPITTLEGLYNLINLESDESDEEKAQLFFLLGNQITGIKDLNKSIIDVGEIRKHQISKSRINLSALIHTIKDQLKVPESFTINIRVDQHLELETDGELLAVLLKELIENSITHRKDEFADSMLSIEITRKSKVIKISIEDNGKGIPKKFKDDYFKMFLRADAKSSGFGLGLYKAKLAADMLGIKLKIKSKEKVGTKALLTIPNK